MKNLITILVGAFLGIVTIVGGVSVNAEVVEKIVAVLDEELILLSELRECAQDPANQLLANLDASGSAEAAALRYMIERRLLQREIDYLAFPKEQELTRTLALRHLIQTYYQGDEVQFAQRLQEQGLAEDAPEIEQELTVYMKGMDYIRRKYRFNAEVNDPATVLHLFQTWLQDLKNRARLQTEF